MHKRQQIFIKIFIILITLRIIRILHDILVCMVKLSKISNIQYLSSSTVSFSYISEGHVILLAFKTEL